MEWVKGVFRRLRTVGKPSGANRQSDDQPRTRTAEILRVQRGAATFFSKSGNLGGT
jgi:hypothetical protein